MLSEMKTLCVFLPVRECRVPPAVGLPREGGLAPRLWLRALGTNPQPSALQVSEASWALQGTGLGPGGSTSSVEMGGREGMNGTEWGESQRNS